MQAAKSPSLLSCALASGVAPFKDVIASHFSHFAGGDWRVLWLNRARTLDVTCNKTSSLAGTMCASINLELKIISSSHYFRLYLHCLRQSGKFQLTARQFLLFAQPLRFHSLLCLPSFLNPLATMGRVGGTALKAVQTLLYAIEFCCGGIILGIYSYFLWWLRHNHRSVPTWEKAVEGLSGAACLCLIFAVLLTCFLGGFSFFAFLGILLDVLFCGAFLAIAVLTRDGADSCSKNRFVHTPLGNGRGSLDINDAPSISFICRLNKTAFAVSIIGA